MARQMQLDISKFPDQPEPRQTTFDMSKLPVQPEDRRTQLDISKLPDQAGGRDFSFLPDQPRYFTEDIQHIQNTFIPFWVVLICLFLLTFLLFKKKKYLYYTIGLMITATLLLLFLPWARIPYVSAPMAFILYMLLAFIPITIIVYAFINLVIETYRSIKKS